MFKTLSAFALTALLSTPLAHAATAVWELDNAHTTIGFSVRHMMMTHVRGSFKTATGTLKVDDKDVSKSAADFTIEVKSLDTGNEKRDEHLKSPDFFDAAKFPSLTFKSGKIVKKRKGLEVHGFITMHGVTKPLVFLVEGPSKAIKDPYGMIRSGLSAKAKLNRKDYGLTWNQAIEAGGVAVGDEVEILIDAEFIRKDGVETPKPTTPIGGEPAPKKE